MPRTPALLVAAGGCPMNGLAPPGDRRLDGWSPAWIETPAVLLSLCAGIACLALHPLRLVKETGAAAR